MNPSDRVIEITTTALHGQPVTLASVTQNGKTWEVRLRKNGVDDSLARRLQLAVGAAIESAFPGSLADVVFE